MDNQSFSFVLTVSLCLGLGTGFVMHRSDFCFASMFRDFFLFRDSFMLRMLLLLVVSGMLFIEIARQAELVPLYPFFLLKPPTLANVIGGFIFGIGMVLAGGCVVSTVYKMGSGSVLSGVAFIGLLAGSGIYAEIHPWWKAVSSYLDFPGEKVTIPQLLGVDPALVVVLVAIPSLICLFSWQRKQKLVRASHAEGYLQPWKAAIFLSFAGLLSCLLIGLPMGITTAYAKMAAYIETLFIPEHVKTVQFFHLVPFKLTIPLTSGYIEGGPGVGFDAIWSKEFFLFVGIVLGAACSAIFLKEFRLHFRVPPTQYASAFIGGTVMALGARFAPACNVLHLIGGIPVLAVSSFLFLAGLAGGAWLGSKILTRLVI